MSRDRFDEARRIASEVLRYDNGNTDKKTLIVRAIMTWINDNVSLIARDHEIQKYRIEGNEQRAFRNAWDNVLQSVTQEAMKKGAMVRRRRRATDRAVRLEADIFVVNPEAVRLSAKDSDKVVKRPEEEEEDEFPELPDEVFE
jgi:Zn-dependent M16 (insulinase) family peptidase